MSHRPKVHREYGYRTVRQVQAHRSRRAKRIDESLRAPIAKTTEQWMNQPNRFDLPNIDTPKRKDVPTEHKTEPTLEAPLPNSGVHRQFIKYLRRQSMRKVYGTRY